MASGKQIISSTIIPATITSSSPTTFKTTNSNTKKKLTKSFSSDNNNTINYSNRGISSNKQCKSKDMSTNAEEKKKRHSFSFGFFSDRSSSKQNNNHSNSKNNSIRSHSTTTREKVSTNTSRSSPKHIQRRDSNSSIQNKISDDGGSTSSPKLTNKIYRITNPAFEKATLYGQRKPSFTTDDEHDEEDTTSRPITNKNSQSHMVPPLAPLNHPVPTILINGEAWNGKTEISDKEEEEDDDPDTRRSIIDHNLFITSSSLIKQGGIMECMVGGKGLHQGYVDTESTFFIKTEEPYDTCSLHVEIKGPKQKPIKITTRLLDENLCTFSYWARRVGYYMIGVKWKGDHVMGSPFDVTILSISKIK